MSDTDTHDSGAPHPTAARAPRQRTPRRLAGPRAGITIAALMGLLGACATPSTKALDTNVPLKPAPDLAGAATPGVVLWRSPDLAAQERATTGYMIQPVTVYRGHGAFFGKLSPEQVNDAAALLTRDVRAAMQHHFKVVGKAGPGVMTLELILVGITPPHQQYVTSGPYNVAALAVGMPDAGGMTAGTVTVAGKFIDSQTGAMLVTFSAPVSPDMMDPPGTAATATGLPDYVEAASQQFATDLVNAIMRQRRINQLNTR